MPFSIWRARSELAANENFTGIDDSLVKVSPKSRSTLVKEAAANTTIAGLPASADQPGLPISGNHNASNAPGTLFNGIRSGQMASCIVAQPAPAIASRMEERRVHR